MKHIDTYVVKYPSLFDEGKYCFYHMFRTRKSACKAARYLIDHYGYEHALIVCIQDDAFNLDDCTVVKREVFL